VQDPQPLTEQEKEVNILSPDQLPLDQSPQLHNNECKDTPMPNIPDKTPLKNGSNDVEVATAETTKRVEIVVGEKWIRKMKSRNERQCKMSLLYGATSGYLGHMELKKKQRWICGG
jgi:hypothetical protein